VGEEETSGKGPFQGKGGVVGRGLVGWWWGRSVGRGQRGVFFFG
jgi:hypothetical protein